MNTNQDLQLDYEIIKHSISHADIAAALGYSVGRWTQIVRAQGWKGIRSGKAVYYPPEVARKMLQFKGHEFPKTAHVIAVQMLKGGVAKTATSTNLAMRLCQYGAKVCLIDMDAQGNASENLGAPKKSKVFADIIDNKVDIEDALIKIHPHLHLLASSFDNAGIDVSMFTRKANPANFVKKHIDSLKKKYDYIIIDCNPSLSMFNTSITLAADEIILPVNPDENSIASLENVKKEFAVIEESYHPLNYKVLLAKFNLANAANREYLATLANSERSNRYSSVIRFSNDYATALATGRTIFQIYRSVLKDDYDRFTREILGMDLDDKNRSMNS